MSYHLNVGSPNVLSSSCGVFSTEALYLTISMVSNYNKQNISLIVQSLFLQLRKFFCDIRHYITYNLTIMIVHANWGVDW